MKRLLILACLCGLLTSPLSAQQADSTPTTPDAVLKTMLTGVISSDAEKFTYRAEPELKARVTPEVMVRLGGSLGPKLKAGYTSTLLGQLKQGGMVTYLYKIEFKNGSDDLLVRLSVRDSKVAAIFFE